MMKLLPSVPIHHHPLASGPPLKCSDLLGNAGWLPIGALVRV